MRTLLRTIVLSAPLLLAPIASAQYGLKTPLTESLQPDVLPRDATLIADTLKLEDWQRPILENLIEDYTADFKAGVDTAVQKMRDVAKGTKGGSAAKGLFAPLEAWRPEKQQLYESFMANLKGLLSDVQMERWPKFERTMRRERMLNDHELDGEGVDLSAVVRQMQLPRDVADSAQASVDAYEVALDAALLEREAAIDGMMGPLSEIMENGDTTRGFELQSRIMQVRVVVRDLQDGWVERIAAALPEPHGGQFRERAMAIGYREAYQPDPLAPFFQTVLAVQSLTPEQRAAIEQARGKWDEELRSIRDRMVAALRVDGPLKPKRNAAAKAGKSGGPAVDVPKEAMITVRAEKAKSVNATREAVKALLTPEQEETLSGGDPSMRPPVPASQGGGGGKDGGGFRSPVDRAPDPEGEAAPLPEGRKPGTRRPAPPASPDGGAPKDPPQ